ncbi:MAG: hypothetical protein EGQ00_00215, partial [Parabacteroides johnsonii]|nr:hypothetical protein [Parabacteroides johnsonii]
RKRTGLINQIFIRSVFMRSRAGRGNKVVLTHLPAFLKNGRGPSLHNGEKSLTSHSLQMI